MDEDLFRPPWEDDAPPRAPTLLAGAGHLLIPLARAQDAVARLETSVAVAPEHIAAGLRARLALFEAAGCLAHLGAAVHPHDLALRDANLTGSYTVAALTGRLAASAPWTTEQGGEGPLPDDHLVANALAYARLWRRLAELATVQPLASVDSLRPRRTVEAPRLRMRLFAALLVGAGVPDGRPGATGRVCFPAQLPRLRRRGGPARRPRTQRLHAASHRLAGLPGGSRSRLPAAGAIVLREPLVTGRLLARSFGVSGRAGLDLAIRLVAAGVLREMTGRAAWRAFTVA